MNNMKKLLALLLAVVMVMGMFPMGAMAEENEPELCTCGLVLDHEGECQTVEPAPQELDEPELCDCGLAKGHEGECKTAEPELCDCGLTKGHEGECQTAEPEKCDCGLTKGHDGECQKTEPEKCDCGLVLDHEGECQKAEEIKCGICQGEHEDKDCTYCLLCKTDRSNCTICAECDAHAGHHSFNCSQYKAPDMATPPQDQSLYEKLMAAETLDEMYDMYMEAWFADEEVVKALTEEEILNLLALLDELNNQEEEENENYMLLADELFALPGMTCPECHELGGHTPECTRNGGYFAAAPLSAFLADPKSGEYYLDGNTNLTDTLTIPKNCVVTIDLNGYVLQRSGNKTTEMIQVAAEATLTLKDSRPTVSHKGNINAEGLWKWENGNYDGKSKGGIIYSRGLGKGIVVNGTLNMQGGTIAGCKGPFGAAITGSSSARMYITGGKIFGNLSTGNGDLISGAIFANAPNENTGAILEISNATITDNTGLGHGGAIYGYNIKLNDCTITNNKAMNGAAVYAYARGPLTISDCTISGNVATDSNGGALAGDDITITNSTISENTAKYGGGVYLGTGGTLSVSGSTIQDNTVTERGGGIYTLKNATVTLTDTTIGGNKATVYGGGAFIETGATVNVTGCTIEDNKAYGAGGGMYIHQNGTVSIDDTTVDDNYAGVDGGGIYTRSNTTVSNTEITNNRAMSTETGGTPLVNSGRGGGFYISGQKDVLVEATFENVTVAHNSCFYYGGGGQVCNYAKLTIDDGTVFEYNKALLHGAGALHVTGDAIFVMNGGIMRNNFAQSVGGAIHSSYTCVLELNGGQIINNTANGRGGGININTGGAITLGSGLTIRGNTVNNEGTGIEGSVNEDGYYIEGTIVKAKAKNNGYGGGLCIDSSVCTVDGATISGNHAAVGGGGIALVMLNGTVASALPDIRVCEFSMVSGTISSNTSAKDGAGVYMMANGLEQTLRDNYPETSEDEKATTYDKAVEILGDNLTAKPSAVVSGGTIQNNTATVNGGGLYLDKDTTFEIKGSGAITANEAVDGAGVYIAKGTATIKGGSVSSNIASANGGGLYVGGDVTMSDGIIDNNEAVFNGGALYINNGDFSMTSGKIVDNKATAEKASGGGVYVNGGDITIGVAGCNGGVIETKHTVDGYKDKIHPIIQNNDAKDSGGGVALIGSGNLTMYCGDVVSNKAPNSGRGLNIYMEGGTFTYYKGNVGKLESPELVIVGGKLEDKNAQGTVTLFYYHCNIDGHNHEGALADKKATASTGSKFNLPDAEKYWDADEGYRAFGWTFYGPNDTNAQKQVRSKNDYQPLGTVTQATSDMHMYALWAPEKSNITYVDGMTFQVVSSKQPVDYTIADEMYTLSIQPIEKPGYIVTGWYIYQDEDQNANWGYEPVYEGSNKTYGNLDYENLQFIPADSNEVTKLDVPALTFGDITLIAKFEPAYTSLRISKSGWNAVDENQTFIFNISGQPNNKKLDPINMNVVIQGNGFVQIKELPVGTYTVKEISGWSWRYEAHSDNVGFGADPSVQTVKALDPMVDYYARFVNDRGNPYWLSGDSYCENWWGKTGVLRPIN